jgi:hypothetical protein
MDLKSELGSRRAGGEATEKTDALLRSADAELPRAYFALVPGCLPAGAKYGLPYVALSLRRAKYGQEWIRTTEGVKPADLQSAPFGHFGTYPE